MNSAQKRNQLKVLIVENSDVVAGRIRNLLSEFSEISVVGEAVNGREAMTIMQIMTPDAVLLDISIPGKSGMHILKEIKEKYSATKVVMFTNHADPYFRNICRELGADYFFDKSTEFEKIPGVLVSML